MWSVETVKELIKSKLGDYSIILISNRGPYVHVKKGKEVISKRSVGGLVLALEPVMRTCQGTWIAWGSGDADEEVVDEHNKVSVPPENPKYSLKMVWLNEDIVNGFYFGLSNEALWPLCHIAYVEPNFEKEDWNYYQKANKLYAEAALEEAKGAERVIIWLHDYHLTLAPKLIKDMMPKAVLAQFWHIPWPCPEVFKICPWKREILEGLLANDLMGFHLRQHCINFLATVEKELEAEIDYKRLVAKYEGHETRVRPFPISVNFTGVDSRAKMPDVKREMKKIKSELKSEFFGFGVDRIDYTKGIPQKLRAVDRFFEKYPEYKNRLVFVQAGAPSRGKIPAYRELNKNIDRLVRSINKRHKTKNWKPIVHLRKKLDYVRLVGYYRLADFLIVNSLEDGMNLVAKEFIGAQRDKNGSLILSKFAGASEELNEAIIINPYDIEEIAESIKKSLEMSKAERRKRMTKLRKSVKENNIYKWVGDFLTEVARLT